MRGDGYHHAQTAGPRGHSQISYILQSAAPIKNLLACESIKPSTSKFGNQNTLLLVSVPAGRSYIVKWSNENQYFHFSVLVNINKQLLLRCILPTPRPSSLAISLHCQKTVTLCLYLSTQLWRVGCLLLILLLLSFFASLVIVIEWSSASKLI